MAADGHIVLATKVDTSGIDKGTSTIKNALSRLKNAFKGLGKTQADALTINNTETLAKIDEIKKKIAELDEERDKLFKEQTSIYESYIPDINDKDLFANFDPETAMTDADLAKYNELSEKIDKAEQEARQLREELEKVGETASKSADEANDGFGNKLTGALEGCGKAFSDLGKKIAQTAKRLLIYQAIYKVMKALIDLIKNILMSDEEFRNDWEELKAALITAAQPLISIIVPAIKAIVALVRDWAVAIGKIAAALAGMTYKQYVEMAKSTKKSADDFSDMEKSAKSIKKALAGFDDLQILTSGGSQSSDGSGNDYTGFDSIIASEDTYDTSQVQSTLKAILAVAGGLLAGIGLVFLTKGKVSWGLGFIIAGAAFWAIGEIWGVYDPGSVLSLLKSICDTVATALAGIGLVLITKGKIKWGLAFIIAGAAIWGIKKIIEGTFSTDPVLNTLIKVMAIAATVLAAIGIILIVFGQIPWGIAALAVGVVALVSAIALSSSKIVQMLQGPLGIIMAIVGTALLVLGIILVCTGVNLPLGIALIAAGATSLVTVIAANKNGILNTIKSVWKSIQNFWNTHIKKVFTREWWAQLGKDCWNGLLSVFESGANAAIGVLESILNFFVNSINKISFDVPDWVPGIGGKKFGFNLEKVSFKKVSIPRLAQGAVIPANHEFMAVLGDQKNGRNLETPEGLMRQIFREELDSAGGRTNSNSNGSTTVILEVDGREFGRAVYEYNNKESRRIGTRLVTV